MEDIMDDVVYGNDYNEFSRSYTSVMQSAASDVFMRMKSARTASIAKYGFDGRFEKHNGLTVREILADTENEEQILPSESGVLDGVRFDLYDAPGNGESAGGKGDTSI